MVGPKNQTNKTAQQVSAKREDSYVNVIVFLLLTLTLVVTRIFHNLLERVIILIKIRMVEKYSIYHALN